MNAVGKNLKQLRQREKLTQDALAERLHVTRQAVSSWETGKTQPDIETLTTLAEALNADVRELIYGPGRIERPYARFQLRYIICTVICALILLAWLVMEWTLEPYLTRLQMEAFDVYPRLFYILLVPPLACAAAGVLIPSAISLWGGYPPAFPNAAALSAGVGPAGADSTPAVCHSVHESMAGFYGELPSAPDLAGYNFLHR